MLTQSGIHESEWRWIRNDLDHTIDNDGSLELLKIRLIKCLTKSFGSDKILESTKGTI